MTSHCIVSDIVGEPWVFVEPLVVEVSTVRNWEFYLRMAGFDTNLNRSVF